MQLKQLFPQEFGMVDRRDALQRTIGVTKERLPRTEQSLIGCDLSTRSTAKFVPQYDNIIDYIVKHFLNILTSYSLVSSVYSIFS